MKNLTLLGLVFLLIFSCIGIIACEKGTEKANTESPPTDDQSPPPQEETSTDSGTFWDLPLLTGTKQIQKGNWSIPAAPGTWSNWEWRYYESYAAPHELATFYRTQQLPNDGWNEVTWMETEELKWGFWTKNNESDGAMVWILWEGGREVYLALMRASK